MKQEIIPGVEVKNTKDENTLVDVRINNPLKRITQLLEQIKKQKAFSFDFKGSLGFAGVTVILTTFGIFGSSHLLCSKGTQSHIGVIKVLQTSNEEEITVFDNFVTAINALIGKDTMRKSSSRIVLVKADLTVLHMEYLGNSFSIPSLKRVIATGEYDSCSQTLTVKNKNDVEIFN